MRDDPTPLELDTDIFILGGGLAGMLLALHLAPLRVALVHPGAAPGQGSASQLARGGVACALAPNDDPALHALDTCVVADGLASEPVARAMTARAHTLIPALEELGVRFDRDVQALRFGLEAAHSRRRILSAGGDATGAHISAAIAARVQEAAHITPLYGWRAISLHAEDDHIAGLILRDPQGQLRSCIARVVALATGGAGQLYAQTSNPPGALGHGLALAHQAGARLVDLEFVQFHPTGLAIAGLTTKPLLTEALRGAGARLVTASGAPLMDGIHADFELAPRDIVARAIHRAIELGQDAYLDLRPIRHTLSARFPAALADCAAHGLDPRAAPLPIVPVAHYHMGGVEVDLHGQTSLRGLWALGEVACTGLHGANRLASNSLMEAVILAHHAAQSILDDGSPCSSTSRSAAHHRAMRRALLTQQDSDAAPLPDDELLAILRPTMTRHVGILRDGDGLQSALAHLIGLERAWQLTPESSLTLRAAQLITRAALRREESRGAHYRQDHPTRHSEWALHQRVTHDDWSLSA